MTDLATESSLPRWSSTTQGPGARVLALSAIEKWESGKPLRCSNSQARAFAYTMRLGKIAPTARLGPGKRARQKRMRHLLTIWRGVSRREEMRQRVC
jgi:hypothetical protein